MKKNILDIINWPQLCYQAKLFIIYQFPFYCDIAIIFSDITTSVRMTDDFVDYSELIVDEVGSELEEEEEETIKVRTRGKDIDWQDLELFDGPDEYNRSEIKKEICEIMIRKKQWQNNESRCENFVCKYFDKRGWKNV